MSGFLKGQIDTERGYFSVYSENQDMKASDDQNRMMSMVLGGIASISLLVGGIGIMNIMLVTVTERTREIGIRKAIGAKRKSILAQFLIEASVVCGVGGLLGIAIGVAGTLVAGQLILRAVVLPDLPMSAGAFLFSVAMGVGFGIYPAAKASKLQPVVAPPGRLSYRKLRPSDGQRPVWQQTKKQRESGPGAPHRGAAVPMSICSPALSGRTLAWRRILPQLVGSSTPVLGIESDRRRSQV